MKGIMAIAASMLLVSTASAGDLVREFQGTGNKLTPAFTVEGPWIIDWRLDSDYEMKIALDIVLVDARTGKFVGGVKSGSRNNVTARSNGVRLFHTSGRYQLRISSSLARWRIKIEQLTEEEAELYTPVNSN